MGKIQRKMRLTPPPNPIPVDGEGEHDRLDAACGWEWYRRSACPKNRQKAGCRVSG
ncbi:MAG: hypothetical protein MUC60_06850 [Oscillatoria sp. Prado101]|nr:hypothetical protein [Oscillatoria sp. Prado101]